MTDKEPPPKADTTENLVFSYTPKDNGNIESFRHPIKTDYNGKISSAISMMPL